LFYEQWCEGSLPHRTHAVESGEVQVAPNPTPRAKRARSHSWSSASDSESGTAQQKLGKATRNFTDVAKRGRMVRTTYDFINTKTCRRASLLAPFPHSEVLQENCGWCDICARHNRYELMLKTCMGEPDIDQEAKVRATPLPALLRPALEKLLLDARYRIWRERLYQPGSLVMPSAVFPASNAKKLAQAWPTVSDLSQFNLLLGWEGTFREQYGTTLFDEATTFAIDTIKSAKAQRSAKLIAAHVRRREQTNDNQRLSSSVEIIRASTALRGRSINIPPSTPATAPNLKRLKTKQTTTTTPVSPAAFYTPATQRPLPPHTAVSPSPSFIIHQDKPATPSSSSLRRSGRPRTPTRKLKEQLGLHSKSRVASTASGI
jgi:hypothetical protein